ncbi:hypothetical protein WA158_003030 [Blastocystis sp. Blastoise]
MGESYCEDYAFMPVFINQFDKHLYSMMANLISNMKKKNRKYLEELTGKYTDEDETRFYQMMWNHTRDLYVEDDMKMDQEIEAARNEEKNLISRYQELCAMLGIACDVDILTGRPNSRISDIGFPTVISCIQSRTVLIQEKIQSLLVKCENAKKNVLRLLEEIVDFMKKLKLDSRGYESEIDKIQSSDFIIRRETQETFMDTKIKLKELYDKNVSLLQIELSDIYTLSESLSVTDPFSFPCYTDVESPYKDVIQYVDCFSSDYKEEQIYDEERDYITDINSFVKTYGATDDSLKLLTDFKAKLQRIKESREWFLQNINTCCELYKSILIEFGFECPSSSVDTSFESLSLHTINNNYMYLIYLNGFISQRKSEIKLKVINTLQEYWLSTYMSTPFLYASAYIYTPKAFAAISSRYIQYQFMDSIRDKDIIELLDCLGVYRMLKDRERALNTLKMKVSCRNYYRGELQDIEEIKVMKREGKKHVSNSCIQKMMNEKDTKLLLEQYSNDVNREWIQFEDQFGILSISKDKFESQVKSEPPKKKMRKV